MAGSDAISTIRWRLPFLSILLFASGACALVYQTAWLRELRLIFGGATPATAAVLAVFMGGLGLGGVWFGQRAERTSRVLHLYAWIEIGIGLSAALSPFLLDLSRAIYLRTGGVLTLGAFGATCMHLLLSVVVLGVPCFLLGGNLPPAVKWVTTERDRHRGALGVIYGINALGAVAGVLVSTFWALEHLGTRATLWSATGVNLLVGLLAIAVARQEADNESVERGSADEPLRSDAIRGAPALPRAFPTPPQAPPRFVYAAAAVTGFTFFLAELVWFRMLTPLLGGSVYCFGLILAEVLLGIAMGGGLYRTLFAPHSGCVHLGTLALLATAQAVVFALPWALGDRWAVMSYHLLQWRSLGFPGLAAGWSVSVSGLVLAPATLAGIQFPLLVGLLGEGRRDAARQVGVAYAANTGGSILGSILGGFVLIPWLTAPGCWRLGIALTLVLGFAALLLWERPWRPAVLMGTLGLGVLSVALGFHADGPTSAWRHTALGYGVIQNLPTAPDELEDRMRSHRRDVVREYEGREASIAVVAGDEGWALFSNGKADGSALSDAGTQVMLGLIPALQHPDPHTAFVIGLGTGTTAGWLADAPGMTAVDVVELEPRVLDVAHEFFRPVNRDIFAKTNVQFIIGDAREVLLATGKTYDLIVSEPPNPYRAGVASLFTREYYQAVRQRLAPGGIFSQWLQGYQLSVDSVQVVYATLLSVFPHVETWATQGNDLAFICPLETPSYSLATIEDRIRSPLYAEALGRAWWVGSIEGFFGRHIAGTKMARRVAAGAIAINTDDRNILEYGFARSQLGHAGFRYPDLLVEAGTAEDDQPTHLRGVLNPGLLLEARLMFLASEGVLTEAPPELKGKNSERGLAMIAWGNSKHAEVLQLWRGSPGSPAEMLMLALSAAQVASADDAGPLVDAIRPNWPVEAAIASSWLAHRSGKSDQAVSHLSRAFQIMSVHPWVLDVALDGVVELTRQIVTAEPRHAEALLVAWFTPRAVGQLARGAPIVWFRLALHLPVARRLDVLAAIGPHHPWTREFLEFRWKTLDAARHPAASQALRDLTRLERQQGRSLKDVFKSPEPATPEGR